MKLKKFHSMIPKRMKSHLRLWPYQGKPEAPKLFYNTSYPLLHQ